jgi:hypothetical protein
VPLNSDAIAVREAERGKYPQFCGFTYRGEAARRNSRTGLREVVAQKQRRFLIVVRTCSRGLVALVGAGALYIRVPMRRTSARRRYRTEFSSAMQGEA